jgi:hypothetical protein
MLAAALAACGGPGASHVVDGGERIDAGAMDGGSHDASGGDVGTDSGAPDAAPLDPIDAYLEEEARERCRMVLLCESELRSHVDPEGLVDFQSFIELACHPGLERSDLSYAVKRRAIRRALREGRARFDAEAGAECLRLLRTVDGCEPAPDCPPVFEGLVPEGGSCHRWGDEHAINDGTAECAGGLPCIVDARMECDGVCTPYPAEGEPCTRLYECAPGLACVDLVCVVLPAAGEPCVGTDGVCDDHSLCQDGTCEPGPGIGGACTAATGRPGRDGCELALHCAVAPDMSLECADLAAAGEGDLCFWLPYDSCPDPLRCHPTHDEWGTCGAGAVEGESCSVERACIPGLRCSGGVCRRLVLPGERCSPDALCPRTHFCEVDRCIPRPLAGEPCSGGARCLEGMCAAGRCERAPDGAPCDADALVPLGACVHECVGVDEATLLGTCEDRGDRGWCGLTR